MATKLIQGMMTLKRTTAAFLAAVLFAVVLIDAIPTYAYSDEEIVKAEIEALYEEMYEEEYDWVCEDMSEEEISALDTMSLQSAGNTELYEDFPASYRPYLVKLHNLFPNWTFIADETGLDFEEAVLQECESDRSLVNIKQSNGSYTLSSWKSLETKSFDYSKNEWKTPPSESSGWHYASKEIIAYHMDPRNFLVTTTDNKIRSVFQFLDYSYDPATQTREGLEAMVSGTFLAEEVKYGVSMSGTGAALMTESFLEADNTEENETEPIKTATPSEAENAEEEEAEPAEPASPSEVRKTEEITAEPEMAEASPESGNTDTAEFEEPALQSSSSQKSYVDIIMEAAAEYGMSPYVIASFIIQEQGTSGSSELISGTNTKYPGMYNYLNVGAYSTSGMTSVERGLWYAAGGGNSVKKYGRPWDTPEKAIKGGVEYLSENYLEKGQKTIYYKKFNVVSLPLYLNQYMTNIQGAQSEGWLLGKFYEDNNLQQTAFSFHIPVYENMPDTACSKPTGDGNQNNRLKGLSVEGYSLSPSFSMENHFYTVTVEPGATQVNVNAAAAADTTEVSGDGVRILQSSAQVLKVETEAESGRRGTYYITVKGGNGGGQAASGTVTTVINGAEYGSVVGDSTINAEIGTQIIVTGNVVTVGSNTLNAVPKAEDEDYKYRFMGWELSDPIVTENSTVSATFKRSAKKYYTITWQYEDETLIDATTVCAGEIPAHSNPSKKSDSTYTYSFKEWSPKLAPAVGNKVYTAMFTKTKKQSNSGSSSSGSSGGGSSGGGGGGGAVGPVAKKTSATFSEFWFMGANGEWQISNSGQLVKSAWLCDDDVASNGQNVWYLMNTDGTMLAAGLVQDNTGNYYSLETNHNGYYGMLRYQDGTYDCDGVKIYMEFSRKHDGTFGAVKNQEAIDALKAKYGVTRFGVGNESCTYTSTFK